MWANISNQGTAMGETALCDDHQHAGDRSFVREAIARAQAADDWNGMTARKRCSGNTQLECFACA